MDLDVCHLHKNPQLSLLMSVGPASHAFADASTSNTQIQIASSTFMAMLYSCLSAARLLKMKWMELGITVSSEAPRTCLAVAAVPITNVLPDPVWPYANT